MKSPDAEKQKPAFWAGSLNSGARTRNRTKDSFLQQRNHRITVSYLYASIPNVPPFCTMHQVANYKTTSGLLLFECVFVRPVTLQAL